MMKMLGRPLQYGSVCSGIEAVTLAWQPLGLIPAWFAEIDPFANAVLSHHYPLVPNLGDMTCITPRIATGRVYPPDILVGGTPCQSFSIAGMRRGLADPRGTLTLKYVELANAIDDARTTQGQAPAIVVWENVSGVLSDRANAFGCFLGALVGEGRALQPSGRTWTHAGCVYGPQRSAAWRLVDAQYFGLAQRRQRVFVVASARHDVDPAAVLFEPDGLRRNTPPRSQTFEAVAASTSARTTGADGTGTRSPGSHSEEALSVCFGGNRTSGPIDRAACLTARGQRGDFESETFAVQIPAASVSHPLTCAPGVTEDGNGRGLPIISIACCIDAAKQLSVCGDDHLFAFAQNSRGELRLQGGHGQQVGALTGGGGKPGQGLPMIASAPCTPEHSDDVNSHAAAEGYFECRQDPRTGKSGWPHWHVRRLMPIECERLQGLPDNYTLVPYRGSPACDGPRYKAIGNSMAVTCVRWIGNRLLSVIDQAGRSTARPTRRSRR
jgi:DNA (cytosine-5)-methyltransferase 1